jgi:hypothetical protein
MESRPVLRKVSVGVGGAVTARRTTPFAAWDAVLERHKMCILSKGLKYVPQGLKPALLLRHLRHD